jgi:hypothetical protein
LILLGFFPIDTLLGVSFSCRWVWIGCQFQILRRGEAKGLGQCRPEAHAILFHNCEATSEVPEKRRVPQKTLRYVHDIICDHAIRQAQYDNPWIERWRVSTHIGEVQVARQKYCSRGLSFGRDFVITCVR